MKVCPSIHSYDRTSILKNFWNWIEFLSELNNFLLTILGTSSKKKLEFSNGGKGVQKEGEKSNFSNLLHQPQLEPLPN